MRTTCCYEVRQTLYHRIAVHPLHSGRLPPPLPSLLLPRPVLSGEAILAAGCMLKNTESVLGLVFSTGTDTKINFSSSRPKWYQVNEGERRGGRVVGRREP